MRRLRRSLSSLFVAALALAALGANDASLIAGTFDPPRAAPELGLAGSDGATLSLERYRGVVVALAFGFTSCPEVCPTTLAVLAQARKKLGAKAGELQVVYVTVDPERDDAARLKQYLAGFDPSFVGGTGTDAQLAAVRRDFGIQAEKRASADGATFSHSSFIYLIDRGGELRGAHAVRTHPRRLRARRRDPARGVGVRWRAGSRAPSPCSCSSRRAGPRSRRWARTRATRCSRSPRDLGAAHGGREARDPAGGGPPDARPARRAAAPQPGRGAAGVRPHGDDARPELPTPFQSAGSYPFACTAHLSGQLLVVVEEFPATPWARLIWRLGGLWAESREYFRRSVRSPS